MKKFFEVLIVCCLFTVVGFLYRGQQRITLNEGMGWDGLHYYNMAEQVRQHAYPVKEALPYINRIGTPALVGWVSEYTGMKLLDSAFALNHFAVLVTAILLVFWLSAFINVTWIRILLISLYLVHWLMPLRFAFFYPVITDAWGGVWFLTGLFLLDAVRKSFHDTFGNLFLKVFLFSVVAGIGNLFRESNAILAFALFFIVNPFGDFKFTRQQLTFSAGWLWLRKLPEIYADRRILLFLLPFLFIFLANVIRSKFTEVDGAGGYAYLSTAICWLYMKSLPEYLLAVFSAFGPVLLLVPYFFYKYKGLLVARQELTFLLATAFIFGLIGGSDTERIIYMSAFPFMFILIGLAIKEIFYSPQRWWLYVLLVCQTIAFRLYWTTPDFPPVSADMPVPFFTPLGSNFNYLFLYSNSGHPILNTLLFAEYAGLLVLTLYVLHSKVRLKRGL